MSVQRSTAENNSIDIAVTYGAPPRRSKGIGVSGMSLSDLSGCMNNFIQQNHYALAFGFFAGRCFDSTVNICWTVRAGIAGAAHCSG